MTKVLSENILPALKNKVQEIADEAVKGTESAITSLQQEDTKLQKQIDAITASSNVKDIVGTKAELDAYDKSKLGDKDIIKVLQDESQGGATAYYRYSTSTSSFTLIGDEGPFYTKSEADTLLNAKQATLVSGTNIKTINNTSILGSGNITISGNAGTITGVSANGTSVATSGVANIPAASTTVYGVTKLYDATDSTSTVLAATANAVKKAYDLANGKGNGTITAVQANGTSIATSGVANIPAASTSAYGVTQLSTSTSSSSTALAATASAVKAVMDEVNKKTTITAQTTDPGTGATLATGNIIAVYVS